MDNNIRVCSVGVMWIKISHPRPLGSWYMKKTIKGFIRSFHAPWPSIHGSLILIQFTPKFVVLFFPKLLFVKRAWQDYPVKVAREKKIGSGEHTIEISAYSYPTTFDWSSSGDIQFTKLRRARDKVCCRHINSNLLLTSRAVRATYESACSKLHPLLNNLERYYSFGDFIIFKF